MRSPSSYRSIGTNEKLSSVEYDDNFKDDEDEYMDLPSEKKSLYYSYPVLVERTWKNFHRQTDQLICRFKYLMFSGFILTLIYAPIGNDQYSVQNRIGILYQMSSIGISAGMIASTEIIRHEKRIFQREYLDGIYSSYAYILSYFTIATPILILSSMCFSLFMTMAIGLGRNGQYFADFTIIMVCYFLLGECVGVFFCSIFNHLDFAWSIVGLITTFFSKCSFFCRLLMFFFFICCYFS